MTPRFIDPLAQTSAGGFRTDSNYGEHGGHGEETVFRRSLCVCALWSVWREVLRRTVNTEGNRSIGLSTAVRVKMLEEVILYTRLMHAFMVGLVVPSPAPPS